MTGPWKPGDVASIRVNAVVWVRVLRHPDGYWTDHTATRWDDNEAREVRDLATIDPKDRKAVERLILALPDVADWGFARPKDCNNADDLTVDDDVADNFQAALREFAAPTPPRPDEPTGLGAVVEDSDGELWIRGPQHNSWKWLRTARPGCENYAEIDVVRVLSEGIQQP